MKFAYLIEPPFNYLEPDGAATGCDVELARYVVGEVGETFEPIETEFAELLPGLSRDRWRMTTGLFANDERKRFARFSRPIWALPDGFLVRRGNPQGVSGYASLAARNLRVAVIRDQIQHHTVAASGLAPGNVLILDTYEMAAAAVAAGEADAYASVARAHIGYLALHPDLDLDVVGVPTAEKPPAKGAFAFSPDDDALRLAVDAVLAAFIGTPQHRMMMNRFGFTDAEIDLLLE